MVLLGVKIQASDQNLSQDEIKCRFSVKEEEEQMLLKRKCYVAAKEEEKKRPLKRRGKVIVPGSASAEPNAPQTFYVAAKEDEEERPRNRPAEVIESLMGAGKIEKVCEALEHGEVQTGEANVEWQGEEQPICCNAAT